MKYKNKNSNGFILVATIWIMAALVLMVSTFAVWVESSLDLAIEQNNINTKLIHSSSTKEILLYILATEGATPAGIALSIDNAQPQEVKGMSIDDFIGGGNIVVDDMGAKTTSISGKELLTNDTLYSGVEGALFSIRDMSGLVPVNSREVAYMEKVLAALNVEENVAKKLLMTLQDYIDKDDAVRANGAESFQYRRLGMPYIKNAPLRTKYELSSVLGWKEIEKEWRNEKVLSDLGAVSLEPFNINAISARLAQIIYQLNDEEAQRFINERKANVFKSMRDLVERTGIDFYPYIDNINFYNSNHFRLSFYISDARLKREINVYFAPQGNAPWVISSDLTLPIMETDTLVKPRQPQTSLFR